MDIKEIAVKFTANVEDYRKRTQEVVKKNKEITKTGQEMSRQMTEAMQKIADKIQEQKESMQLLSKKYQDKVKEVSELSKKLSELTAQYDKAKRAEAEFGDTKGIRQQREDLIKSIHDMEAELSKMRDKLSVAPKGLASTDKLKAELAERKSQIHNSKKEVELLDQALKDIGDKSYESLRSEIASTTAAITRAKTEQLSLSNQMNKGERTIAAHTRQLSKMGYETQQDTQKTNKLSGAFGKLKNTKAITDKAKQGLHSIGGAADSATKKLTKTVSSIRRLGIVALGLRLIKSVFGELRTVMTSYLQQNEALNNRVEALKNAFGQALAPAIELVVSLFEKLMPIILGITQAITDLIGSLGIVKKLKDTSGALDGVTNSTNKLAKAQKQLFGFDQITKINKQEDDSGSGTPSYTYDTSAFSKLIDQLKAAVENGQWAEIGQLLGIKVNSLFDKVDFAALGEKLGRGIQHAFELAFNFLGTVNFQNIGAKIAEFLNNAISNIDFSLVGATFARMWNSLIDTFYGFVSNFDWAKFGKSIADAINGWFDEIDLNKLADTLQTLAHGLLTALTEAVENTNWSDIGKKIGEALSRIDFSTLCGDLAKLISSSLIGLVDLLCGFLEGMDWQNFGSEIVDSLISIVTNIDWSELTASLFEGIGAAIGAIAGLFGGIQHRINVWIAEKIIEFKDKTKEHGGSLIGGLWDGITKALENVGTWVVDNIFKPFVTGIKNAFGIKDSETSDEMKPAGKSISKGILLGVNNSWSSIPETINGKFTEIKTKTSTWANDMKGKVTTAFGNMKNDIATTFDNVKTKISNVWDKVLTDTKSFINKFLGFIENMLNKPVNGINKLIEKVNSIGSIKLPGEKSLGINIPLLSTVNIPRLAEGGIVDRPTVAMVGEAGKEAVMPLENNTSWINKLASQIVGLLSETNGGGKSSSLTIPVYIGNTLLSTIMLDDMEKGTARRTTAPLKT